MCLKPQDKRFLATWHPREPEPSIRHFVYLKISRLRPGTILHFISFKFKSTASSAITL
jgi:hypothetical protein